MSTLAATYRCLTGAAFLVVSLACAAQLEDPDYIAVSDAVFPQTRNWLDIAHAPVFPVSELQKEKDKLEQAYRTRNSPSNFLEGPSCSFISRALESLEASSFHRMDIDRDGLADIIYVGSAQCAEGSATVIWYGTEKGYVMRQPAIAPLRLLRVSPEGHGATSVSEGCCGAPTDSYYSGNLKNLRQGERLSVLKETTLPSKQFDRALSFKTTREIRLRSSTKILDSHDPVRSEFLGRAAFGNVVRIYLPNSKGVALASTTVNGHQWFFVAMAAESDALASHDPYSGVRAGWLQANDSLRFNR